MKFEIEITGEDFSKLEDFVKSLKRTLPSIYLNKSESPEETIKQLFFLDMAIAFEPTTVIMDLREKIKVRQLQ